jgi:hypothetical protein
LARKDSRLTTMRHRGRALGIQKTDATASSPHRTLACTRRLQTSALPPGPLSAGLSQNKEILGGN